LELIGLTQAVPGPKILGVDLNCVPICLDGPRYILHLQILMAHESPSSKTGPVQLQGLSEIDNGLEVLSHEGIVVTNDAACFRVVLIVVKLLEGQIGQLPLVLLDVEDVGVGVHVLKTVRVDVQQLLEPLQTDVEL
jgi:hypothetical protein